MFIKLGISSVPVLCKASDLVFYKYLYIYNNCFVWPYTLPETNYLPYVKSVYLDMELILFYLLPTQIRKTRFLGRTKNKEEYYADICISFSCAFMLHNITWNNKGMWDVQVTLLYVQHTEVEGNTYPSLLIKNVLYLLYTKCTLKTLTYKLSMRLWAVEK